MNKGFTLIEIIIAVFVMVVALIGLIAVTVMIINANDLNRHRTTATTLANDKLEEIKNLSYNSIVDTAGTTDYWKADSSPGTAGDFFSRTWKVTTVSPNDIKKVEVTVSWTWGGNTHNVVLSTIIAKTG
jgi:type IV pilus assembly protein PilV